MRWGPFSSELLVCVVFDFTMNSWEVPVKGLSHGPWRCSWNNKIPKMVAFYVWTTVLGKILSIDNQIKRKRVLVNQFCMYMSGGVSSVDDLLRHQLVVLEYGLLVGLRDAALM